MIEPCSVPELLKAPIPDPPTGKTPVRLLVCGVEEGVENILHSLYAHGFAEISEWSPSLSSVVSGEVIRILTRYIMLDD